MRGLGVRDGRIIELEKDKAKAVAALESERMEVRVHTLIPIGNSVADMEVTSSMYSKLTFNGYSK